mmetsp:Transcript_34464/g.56087  ORF Transcript_34464/g.56087 Transcript_34464/m.56087 type:complete len:215 (-) Transcript_34464:515-1159(-)
MQQKNSSNKNSHYNGFAAAHMNEQHNEQEDESMLDSSQPSVPKQEDHVFGAFGNIGAFPAAQHERSHNEKEMDTRSDNDVVHDIRFIPQPTAAAADKNDDDKEMDDESKQTIVNQRQPVTDAGFGTGFSSWSQTATAQPAQDKPDNNSFSGFGGGFEFAKTNDKKNTGFSFAATAAWNTNNDDNNTANNNADNKNKNSGWSFGGTGGTGSFGNW